MKKKLFSLVLAAALLCGMIPAVSAANTEAVNAANELHARGLFNGVGTNADGTPNFDLDRTPTRHEAVTMLVAMLGKSSEAQSGNWTTPFTDVADWAKPYVGYAYTNALTSGTSATTYGGNQPVTATQYLTFVLTALGYKNGTDFQWDKAWELSDKLGITNGQYNAASAFTRGDVAIISYNALSAPKKDAQTTPEEPAPSAPKEESLDLQGYWWGINNTSDGSEFVECYNFNGNNYSCAYRCYDANENILFTNYEEGTFTFADGVLTLTCSAEYSYKENSAKTQSSTETRVSEYTVTEYSEGITFNSWGYMRFENTENAYNILKNYVMEHDTAASASLNSADYAYLAGSVFRDVRREYAHAVAQGAYVYAYTDVNGDLCVLSDVRYKIISNYNVVTLHNITKGTKITNPADYYENLANRAYGATKLHYMELQSEVQGHYFKMLSAMSSILGGGSNTYDGVFVDANTLNQ